MTTSYSTEQWDSTDLLGGTGAAIVAAAGPTATIWALAHTGQLDWVIAATVIVWFSPLLPFGFTSLITGDTRDRLRAGARHQHKTATQTLWHMARGLWTHHNRAVRWTHRAGTLGPLAALAATTILL